MQSRSLILLVAAGALRALPLAAQDPAQVEALAPLLMAEDRRELDPAVLGAGLNSPDPVVRQTAATTVGRIGDRHGTVMLLPLLSDPDRNVVTATFFALGLLRDTSAVAAIVARLRRPDSLGDDAVGEAATALDRIGGATAASFIGSAFSGSSEMPPARLAAFVPNAVIDAWRLGARMPVAAILHVADDTSVDLRWRAVYSLGRVRAPAAGRVLQSEMRDPTAVIRETAAQWLTRRFADTTGLAPVAVKAELARALSDDFAGVRVHAANSLASFADSSVTPKIIPLLADGDQNVRVAAVTALGAIKGSLAARAIDVMLDRKDAAWAVRRAGLLALAHADTAAFIHRVATWSSSADFRDRITALDGWAVVDPADPAVFRNALADHDVRVQAAAVDAWLAARRDSSRAVRADTALVAVARARLAAADPGVRAAAARALQSGVALGDLDPLIAAWSASQSDPESDARLAVFRALHALATASPQVVGMLDDASRSAFLDRPADPVLLAEAARSWRDVARRWGDKWPIDTRQSLDDYRTIVRQFLLAGHDPYVTIDVEGRGQIVVELLAREAPLTVANFLRLVDRHYFDGNRWHRVVPDFVVQDGDRSGTGNGGPGWTIRDEINRERYILPMLGMALSGPDTGGSQWFINLSAQPHLDGQYTIFGKVAGGNVALLRVVQGDVIRSISRSAGP